MRFITLKKRTYINLTTFRKTGAAVATPLWFAEHQGVLYTQTFPTAGKLKRIRHTPRVTVAPCTVNGKPLGTEIEGNARILNIRPHLRVTYPGFMPLLFRCFLTGNE